MKTILVLDQDKKLHRLIIDGLKAFGSVTTRKTKDLIVKSATNSKEAAGVLSRFKVDLIVTDVEGSASDGLQLMAYMKQSPHRDIPVVVVTGDSSPEIDSTLKQMGVSHCVKKPFVLLELLEKMFDVLDESSKAIISDFTVPNFLQALEMEKKTCSLKVTSEEKTGYLHLQNGELTDAEAGKLTGDDAAVEILAWEDTKLKVEGLSSNKKRIQGTVMHLLMQAAHAKERRATASSSDPVFDEIITLAEGRHNKQAQKKLTAFLKANPKNHKGWLWYSRVIDKVTLAEKALNNARKIVPDDPEVLEEIDKIELAKQALEGEEISHCPFCWAPLNEKALECPHCRAHLLIDEDLLSRSKDANQQILQQAVDRYTRVVARENSPDAHYYLGIAYLNLGLWTRGLDQLNNSVEAFPDKEFYADQLQVLMRLLTASEDVFAQETVEKEIGSDLGSPEVEETDKKKILIAESSPTIRKAISMTLSKRGYEVIEAGDGLEALNCLDKTRPDVILMDIILPKLDAQRTVSVIRDSSGLKDIPVIVLTSKGGLFGSGKKKVAGSTAYLPKPFDLSELVQATEKYLLS